MLIDLKNEMLKANYIAELQNSQIKPFADQDIRFGEFVQYLRDSCSQREQDLVYFSENYYRVYTILHIEAKTFKKQLTDYDLEIINHFSQCAHRLGLTHLITDGLSKKLVKLFNGFN